MDELRPGTADRPTPAGLLGDIVVCPTVAAAQASKAGHSAHEEMLLLTTHGLLHLLGYDHAEPEDEKEMFDLQRQLLLTFLATRCPTSPSPCSSCSRSSGSPPQPPCRRARSLWSGCLARR